MTHRITRAQQARRVAMAQARVDVHDVCEKRDLTTAEFLMVLAEVQTSIIGRAVRDEHERLGDE